MYLRNFKNISFHLVKRKRKENGPAKKLPAFSVPVEHRPMSEQPAKSILLVIH